MSVVDFFINHNIILTAVLAFALGIWVYSDRRRDLRNLTLSAMLVAVALWSFSLVLWQHSTAPWQAVFWLKSAFAVGTFLPVLFLLFAYVLYAEKMPSTWLQLLLVAPNAFLVMAIFAGVKLVCGLNPDGTVCFGSAKPLLALHFAALTILSLGLLLMAARRSDQRALDRSRLAAVIVGTIISFDVVFAALFAGSVGIGSQQVYVSNIALLIGMFIMSAAVIRSHLLIDLRLVSVELFVIIALIIVVADIVVSRDLVDFSLRLAILVLLVFYGVFTIRNIAREVSRLRRMNVMMDQLTKMNGRLLETDQAKTQLVSFASHQLRAPLGGIRSYLDMLISGDFGPLKPKQKEVIGQSLGAMSQMMETIETFLNIAKAELGKLDLYLSETNLDELIERVLRTFRPLAERKGLELKVKFGQGLPPVMCDGGKIYHVIANLVDNAIKYTETGGVTISGWPQGDKVRVEISDTGAGLTQPELEQLFRIFSRGLAGTRLDHGGSGLGLYLVRKIVQAHKCEVQVTSPGKGQGSSFSFTLPIAASG